MLRQVFYLLGFILLPLRVSIPGTLPQPQLYRASSDSLGSHQLDTSDDTELLPQLPPVYGPYLGYVMIGLAIGCSVMSRRRLICKNTNGFLANVLLEEESMCMATLFLMFFSGFIMRPILGLTLFLWAGINVCHSCSSILEENPTTPGLPLLKPVFEFVKMNMVGLIKIKNYIEVSICILSCVGWLFALNPPFFGIVSMQFLRLKYTTSYYTRFVFNKLNKSASRMPTVKIIYPYSFGMLNTWITSTVKNAPAPEEKAKEEYSDDEPKVSEVPAEDLD